ncbi:MAG: hypothetical protein JSS89_12245 [Bacteroidetes bacterium]|nr:hypothetical protein [Bacteroidota bacterium]
MKKSKKSKPAAAGTHPAKRTKRNPFWTGLDNLKVTLGTKGAWADHAMTVVGGVMYVVLPTAIEAIFKVDLTGWKGYVTSLTTNLLIGGAFRSPGYMAGTLGAGTAHLVYGKLQDSVIKKVFKKYAYRFDPSITTSSMSDDDATAGKPVGTNERTVAGERVNLFPPSPNVARVALEPAAPAAAAVSDNYKQTVSDNYKQSVGDNYKQSLAENFYKTVSSGGFSSSGLEHLTAAMN